MGDESLPATMTHGRTVLCLKDPTKDNAVENYHPMTYLPLTWKLLTGVIAEGMYDYLEQEKLLSEEQKGLLIIDQTVLNDCKKRHTNLSMAWIDYRKAYEFVPHNSINECMKLIGIADNVRNFLEKSMEQWKLSLTSNGEGLGEVGVNRETVFHHCCLF